ncbi:MAG: GatB/YqeY domain-containing protein [Patescibacteria group bacterium]
MTLKEKIRSDTKNALKARAETRLSTLRLLLAAVSNKEIELRKKDVGLSDEEVLDVVKSESKKRRDSITEFKKGGREDLVKKESEESEILSEYLPPELPDEEVARIIDEAIRETGAASQADFGKAMKTAMAVLKGRVSGDRVSNLLRQKLAKQSQ